jgi:hypothetical protein
MNMQRFGLLSISLWLCAPVAQASHEGVERWRPVSEQRLADARGGFDVAGLKASFGFERTISIDGVATTVARLQIPDISKITQAQAASLEAATRSIFVIQNGAGNSVANAPNITGTQAAAVTPAAAPVTSPAPGAPVASTPLPPSASPSAPLPLQAASAASAATIVQNSLNDQYIQSVTTLSTSVNSLGTFRALDWQASLQEALIRAR